MARITIKKTSWDLTPLLKDETEATILQKRAETEAETKKFVAKWKPRHDYLEDPKILLEAIKEFEELESKFSGHGDEWVYFSLLSSKNQIDPQIKAKEAKAEEFADKIANQKRFFWMNIAKVSENQQKKILKYVGLANYKHFLKRLFVEAKYLLTESEEKIMSLKSTPSYAKWIQMTQTFLSKEQRNILTEEGKKELKSLSEIQSLLSSQNKKVRDTAAAAVNEIYEQYKEVAENEMNALLADKKINDELRSFSRPDSSRHIADDVETEVVDSLIKAVSSRFSIPADYYRLKAQLLGLKKLQYHERNVDFGKIDKKYNYQDSAQLVYDVFAKLDQEFAEIFKDLSDSGNIDVYPAQGKRGGAFCSYNLITQPTYVLLNHTDKLTDVLTLAHELGHAVNAELVKKHQTGLNFGTPTSTAEVASTFMEDFVLQELLQDADDELKLSLMIKKLDDDISTIFRQVACYTFEQELHQEFRKAGYLSYEDIGRIFQKNMKDYMGESVEQSPGSQNWWVYWIHIRYYFYVYSYASGLLISKSLQSGVKNNPKFIENVKEFLSAGVSESPKNIFARMNIDITDPKFWDKGLQEIDDLLKETTALAKKLKKL